MPSSEPCKLHSGSVHELSSEYSIEYVQTQSPMSHKVSLTAPISSFMNLSGINIEVGNATAQTMTTWTIPNISVTPIPKNPTNTQIHVYQGQRKKAVSFITG
ncbi:hypothetical protein O181_032893 [Austropuccinia psidii MF-1]|uniref:Uncharacterized protein n=1 Tax=Austropuccinia psidii MF-1 TaxID=1389203 RepID=A0A9Q3H5X9_9BASI|nr:hypothetical protein [Austropuccinia psidii MF-1]